MNQVVISQKVLETKWKDFYYRSLQFAAIMYMKSKIQEYTDYIIEKGFWSANSKSGKATDRILTLVSESGQAELARLISSFRDADRKLPVPSKNSADKYLKTQTGKSDIKDIIEAFKTNPSLIANLERYITNITSTQFNNYINKISTGGVNCSYCGEGITWDKGMQSRLDRAGFQERSYDIDDVVPCCSICNKLKGELSAEEFYNIINKVYNHSTRLPFDTFKENLFSKNKELITIMNEVVAVIDNATQILDQQIQAETKTAAQLFIKKRINKISKMLFNKTNTKETRLNNIKTLFKIATHNKSQELFQEPLQRVHIHNTSPDGGEDEVIFDSATELNEDYIKAMKERKLLNMQDNIIQDYISDSLPKNLKEKLNHLLDKYPLNKAALILAETLDEEENKSADLHKPHDDDDEDFDIPF